MIAVRGVSKFYGSFQALQKVSFTVKRGEIVGFLGPNGAGKTTMMKILTGYLQADEGNVKVVERNILTQTRAAQAQIGYLPENAPLYPELTVQEYLQMMADVRQLPSLQQGDALTQAVQATGLAERLQSPIGQLSKGYRQRVGLAQAILHKPSLLILDEPTVGLDPTQLVEIRSLIRHLAQQSTVLFSTHILPEVEALCNRAIILMDGQVRADAKLSSLASSSNAVVVFEQPVTDAAQILSSLEGVAGLEPLGNLSYRVLGLPGAELTPAIFRLAKAQDWPLRELRHERRTLESVFNELARQAIQTHPNEASAGVSA
jgi:ABC-2 type transport system ATP-binding protein